MSYNNGPKIVTNGLVMYLDAANSRSIVSGSLIFTNLTNRNVTGSLINGPVFNNSNGGSIVFDGNNDYVDFGNQSLGLDLISKSACAWIKKTATSPYGIIDKDFDTGAGYGGWGFWIQNTGKLWWWNHRAQDILDNGPTSVANNVWTFVAVSYNASTKNASFYINGILNSSVTNAAVVEQASTSANLIVGAIRNATLYTFNGSISNVILYNRNLSASEILQNYHASKGRFGL